MKFILLFTKIKEFQDLNKTADDLLFDRVQRNLNGEVIDIKPGKFSEDDLIKLLQTDMEQLNNEK